MTVRAGGTIRSSQTERRIKMNVDELWEKLIRDNYFTEEELQLVTDIAGYSISTLNDCIYSRYGCRSWEQLVEENY